MFFMELFIFYFGIVSVGFIWKYRSFVLTGMNHNYRYELEYSAYALIDTIFWKTSVSIRANVSIRENVTISL